MTDDATTAMAIISRTEFFYEHPRISRPHHDAVSSALVRMDDFSVPLGNDGDTTQLFDLLNDLT